MARTPGKAAKRPRRVRGAQAKFPLVYVKYHDHCWLHSRELDDIAKAGPYVVEETGFLLQVTDRYITLAKERSTDGERNRTTYDDVTVLMCSDILDMRVFPLTNGNGAVHRRNHQNGHGLQRASLPHAREASKQPRRKTSKPRTQPRK